MSPPERTDHRPVRTPAALWRVVDGCAVIFHEETGRAFVLNDTATRVWEMCDGHASIGALCDWLEQGSGEGRADARESVDRLLKQLVEEGFVAMETEVTDEIEAAVAASGIPPVASEGELQPPVAEEIHFAACDCSGGPYGQARNIECLLINPGQAS